MCGAHRSDVPTQHHVIVRSLFPAPSRARIRCALGDATIPCAARLVWRRLPLLPTRAAALLGLSALRSVFVALHVRAPPSACCWHASGCERAAALLLPSGPPLPLRGATCKGLRLRFPCAAMTLKHPLRARSAAMSSDVTALVLALSDKADELCDKGHLLRAAENYGRAAEAARALGADNLVEVCMLLQQSNMSYCYVSSASDATTADPNLVAAHRAACIALLSGAAMALERRRAAGTLLEGKCTAAEAVWRTSVVQRCNDDLPATQAASWGTLCGYEMFLRAAASALNVLARARMFAAECSDAQFQLFAQLVVHAGKLMQRPRRHGDVGMNVEAKFTLRLRIALDDAVENGLNASLVQLLAGAWQRLECSGVLRARSIDKKIREERSENQEFQAAVRKGLMASGLRSCALDGCGAREAHPTHFKSCAACRAVVYCCREHQVAGWPGHKKACKEARKVAAAKKDEVGPSGA